MSPLSSSYCIKCYQRTSTKQAPFSSKKKSQKSTSKTPKPAVGPIVKATKRKLDLAQREAAERENIKALLNKYKYARYEDIPNHFKEKIELYYSIKHQQSYYQKKIARIDQKKFQSAIPHIENNFPQDLRIDLPNAREVWDPYALSEEEVDQYLKEAKNCFLRSKKVQTLCAGQHLNPQIKISHSIEEISLKILHLCKYSTKKALYCLVAKADIFWYDITKQMNDDARQYKIHLSH